MYCPRCREPQPVGSRRCGNCGYSFVANRSAQPRRQGTRTAAVPANRTASTSYREWERGPGSGRRVISCLAILVLAVVIAVAAAAVLSSSVVRPYIGRQITKHLASIGTTQSASTSTSAGSGQSSGSGAVAAVPTPKPGERQIVVTQDELNQRIAAHQSQIKPLDSASVQLTPQGAEVTMRAYGLTGRYHGQVQAENGQVVVTNGHIDGPLGWVVPVSALESALNQQIAASLNQSGVQVDSVTLQQGQMTVGFGGT